jgi:hypothetical protein
MECEGADLQVYLSKRILGTRGPWSNTDICPMEEKTPSRSPGAAWARCHLRMTHIAAKTQTERTAMEL